MIAGLRAVLDGLCAAYRRGSTLVLLFDYDGTLTPIVEHPRLAMLDPDARRLLTRLADRPRVGLGILSGRQLDELEAIVRLPGVYLAGTAGLELDLCGIRTEHPRAGRAATLIERLAEHLEKDVMLYPGAWLERKRLGLAVHYRRLPEHLVAPLRARVQEVAGRFSGELRIVQGPRAWEITPAWGWTKGTAIRLILAHLGAGSKSLLYAGDAPNDAEAMEVAAAMGGIVLGIGPQAPAVAQYQLPDPSALKVFLRRLDASLESRKPAPVRSTRNHLALYGLGKPAVPTNPR
jgi:trehalose 6-phosphate phosphatase